MNTAATLVVHGLPDMSKRGRRDIARWLRVQAAMIEDTDADAFADELTCRYRYTPRAPQVEARANPQG